MYIVWWLGSRLPALWRREGGPEARTAPPNRFSPLLTGLLVPDSQAAGQQELCRQEPGSRGDTGLHVSDLLGQDRDPHSEPHDRVPSLV